MSAAGPPPGARPLGGRRREATLRGDHARARDPGLQPERTELAWSRTALLQVAIAALVIRAGVLGDERALLAAGIVLAAFSVAAIVMGNSRRKQLALAQPTAPGVKLMLLVTAANVFASACAAWIFLR